MIVYVKYLWNWEILHDGGCAICEESLNVFHLMWEFCCDIIVIYGPQSEQFKFLIVICHKVLFVFTGKFHDDVQWYLNITHASLLPTSICMFSRLPMFTLPTKP